MRFGLFSRRVEKIFSDYSWCFSQLHGIELYTFADTVKRFPAVLIASEGAWARFGRHDSYRTKPSIGFKISEVLEAHSAHIWRITA